MTTYNVGEDKKIKYQKGIALVEVIAALGVAIISITALVSLSISTLRTSLDSKLLLEGSKVANREIELVRAYRDQPTITWEDFIIDVRDCAPCSMNVSGDLTVIEGVSKENEGQVEEIVRQFTATNVDGTSIGTDTPDIVRISVSATWEIGGKTKGAYIYTDLSNWRAK